MKLHFGIVLSIAVLVMVACAAPATVAPTKAPEPTQVEEPQVEPTAETPQEAAGEPEVTLSYIIWDNIQEPAHQQMIEAFEAEHPNIHVELEVFSWDSYWDKLNTSLAGNDSYDVFWLNVAELPVLASKGALLDLQPYVTAEQVDLSVFPAYLVDAYTYNGDVYGIPKDVDSIGLFYNKDLFDAAGLEYPNENWTWQDMYDAAAKLTTGDVWGFGMQLWGQPDWYNFVFQNDGSLLSEDKTAVTLDDPAACDAIKYLYSFVEAGYAPDGSVLATSDPEMQLFPGGKLAMFPDGSWMASEFAKLDFNVGVAPLPMGKKHTTMVHGLANVAWSGTKHPDEAWEFVKFLGGDEAMKIQADTGVVIPANKNYRETWAKAIPDMNLQVFLDGLEYGTVLNYGNSGSAWEEIILNTVSDAWSGNISVDEACKLATEDGTAAIVAH